MDHSASNTVNHNTCTQSQCNVILATDKNTINDNPNDNPLNYITHCKGNFCMICGVNMGDDNPRQLCGKTYCMQEDDL